MHCVSTSIYFIVPTLRVGMQLQTLRVESQKDSLFYSRRRASVDEFPRRTWELYTPIPPLFYTFCSKQLEQSRDAMHCVSTVPQLFATKKVKKGGDGYVEIIKPDKINCYYQRRFK